MVIKAGTNRLVIVLKNFVIKLPLLSRGFRANNMEYELSLNNEHVAKTSKRWYGLKQERLFNTLIFNYNTTKEELPTYLQHLWQYKLSNRVQVGQDKNGKWKFFDYEDIKKEV